eukprot:TRINITY_DN1991_c0_g1_i1.p1 TRINITY_DN1991_c0_g1~~TRINITY_DN1991_c0_g1_i1.p1  ORF type:complete len:148 (+),score=24.27 TRINITY_DN1991_c0_g1_i1:59-445(+)
MPKRSQTGPASYNPGWATPPTLKPWKCECECDCECHREERSQSRSRRSSASNSVTNHAPHSSPRHSSPIAGGVMPTAGGSVMPGGGVMPTAGGGGGVMPAGGGDDAHSSTTDMDVEFENAAIYIQGHL